MNLGYHKQILIASLMTSSMAYLPGCTDTEAAIGAGLIGGAIIGHEIGRQHDRDHRNDHRNRRDRHGHRNDRGRGHHQVMSFQSEEVVFSPETLILADKYSIPEASAEILVDALAQAQQDQDLSGLRELGVDRSELLALYKGQRLSEQTMMQMGSVLNLSLEQTSELVDQITQDVEEAQVENSRSGFLGSN